VRTSCSASYSVRQTKHLVLPSSSFLSLSCIYILESSTSVITRTGRVSKIALGVPLLEDLLKRSSDGTPESLP
jgi:hypothetical protein